MSTQTKTIDTVSSLSEVQFNQEFYSCKPVVIKGGLKQSKCYNRWSFEYLKEKVGQRIVDVAYSPNGNYNHAIKEFKWIEGSFDEMIELFRTPKDQNGTYYLVQSSIPEIFPELLDDLETPPLIEESDISNMGNLWMGGEGCNSGLHYDESHNFFYQVMGRKEFAFFSPIDSLHLYASTVQGEKHMSHIELHNLDRERFPLFAKAEQFHCLVDAGDILYIPPGWWHDVVSLDMSISVNYWWHRFDIPSWKGVEMSEVKDICNFINAFINKGLSIDHKDNNGEFLLLKAIENGYLNFVEALLILGANPNAKSYRVKPGTPALLVANDKQQTEIVKLLLKYGATDSYRGSPSIEVNELR